MGVYLLSIIPEFWIFLDTFNLSHVVPSTKGYTTSLFLNSIFIFIVYIQTSFSRDFK